MIKTTPLINQYGELKKKFKRNYLIIFRYMYDGLNLLQCLSVFQPNVKERGCENKSAYYKIE